ncbi:protein kinase domain-containing protein [Streptomyces buecherae]|uniref:protein kinase domain-containing protein n=1 Tax=Streptomyces buecherae TaxID=2763006 RepID=UPI00365AC742
MLGAVLDGRYALVERIGAGGMGEVWRARDERLARDVAVKTLSLPSVADGAVRERLLAMFVREARAAAALDSSYIVPVFDHGNAGDVPYLVMPLLSGRTVRDVLADEGPLPPRRVADIAGQVCRALDSAHRAGVIHRDIKPANVMLTTEGTAKVLDFGIAKFVGAASGSLYLTGTADSPVGTLPYMAPERFTRDGDASPTDIYSLGCMVYELLTGTPPFDATSAAVLMHHHVYETAPRPSQRLPQLDPRWDDLLGAMLGKAPDLRPTAEEARGVFEGLAVGAGPPAVASVSPVLPGPPASVASSMGASGGSTRVTPAPVPPSREPEAPPLPPAPPMAVPPSRRRWWASGIAVVIIAALIATLTVLDPFGADSGAGEGGGKGVSGDTPRGTDEKPAAVASMAKTGTFTVGNASDSQGPARPVTHAQKGGVVTLLEGSSSFLSVKDVEFGDLESPTFGLAYRTLTGFKTEPDGSTKLVGDLAEDPGRTSPDGRTWTFKLKAGLKYSNGATVRAVDFRRSLALALKVDGEGRQSLLNALIEPGSDGAYEPSTIEAPDDRTLVVRLTRPCPDFNVLMSQPALAPIPFAGEAEPPATGPYEVSERSDEGATLTRNRQWRADTDPLRTAYPDRFEVEGDVEPAEAVSRIESAGGEEAILAPGLSLSDSELAASGAETRPAAVVPAGHVEGFIINTARVRSLAVRRAIATALPARDVLRASGDSGTVIHHLMPPALKGSRDFDHYEAGANGDPARARAILDEAGESGFHLTIGGDAMGPAEEAAKAGLEKAGFRVTLKEVAHQDFWPSPHEGDFDVFRMPIGGYGLPVASISFYDLFDGRRGPPFHMNMAQLRSRAVNMAIDAAISADTIDEAAELWAIVDREVMRQAAFIPTHVPTENYLSSPALRGLQADLTGLSPLNAYMGRG